MKKFNSKKVTSVSLALGFALTVGVNGIGQVQAATDFYGPLREQGDTYVFSEVYRRAQDTNDGQLVLIEKIPEESGGKKYIRWLYTFNRRRLDWGGGSKAKLTLPKDATLVGNIKIQREGDQAFYVTLDDIYQNRVKDRMATFSSTRGFPSGTIGYNDMLRRGRQSNNLYFEDGDYDSENSVIQNLKATRTSGVMEFVFKSTLNKRLYIEYKTEYEDHIDPRSLSSVSVIHGGEAGYGRAFAIGAIDRDKDGYPNYVERDAGSSVTDPKSIPLIAELKPDVNNHTYVRGAANGAENGIPLTLIHNSSVDPGSYVRNGRTHRLFEDYDNVRGYRWAGDADLNSRDREQGFTAGAPTTNVDKEQFRDRESITYKKYVVVKFSDKYTQKVPVTYTVRRNPNDDYQAPDFPNNEIRVYRLESKTVNIPVNDNQNVASVRVSGLKNGVTLANAGGGDTVNFAGNQSQETFSFNINVPESVAAGSRFSLDVTAEDASGNQTVKSIPVVVGNYADEKNPTAVPNKVVSGTATPNAEEFIQNRGEMPHGTAYAWKDGRAPTRENPNAQVEVTYPDRTKDLVNVTATFRSYAEDLTPTTQIRTANTEDRDVPSAEEFILNRATLPRDTRFTWEEGHKPTINRNSLTRQSGKVRVTYPDQSSELVDVQLDYRDNTRPTVQKTKDKIVVFRNTDLNSVKVATIEDNIRVTDVRLTDDVGDEYKENIGLNLSTEGILSGKVPSNKTLGRYTRHIKASDAARLSNNNIPATVMEVINVEARGGTIDDRDSANPVNAQDIKNMVVIDAGAVGSNIRDDRTYIESLTIVENNDTNRERTSLPTTGTGNVVKVKVRTVTGIEKIVDVTVNYVELQSVETPREKVKVENLNNLSADEKQAVREKIKAANQTLNLQDGDIEVQNDGNATVTKTGVRTTQIPASDLVEQKPIPVKPVEKVKVLDPSRLTPADIAKVKAAFKTANSQLDLDDSNIDVSENGNVTITKDGIKTTSFLGPAIVEKDTALANALEKVEEAERTAEAARNKLNDIGTIVTPDERDALQDLVDAANRLKGEAQQAVNALNGRPEKPALDQRLTEATVPDVPAVNDANDNGKDDAQEVAAARQKVQDAEEAAQAATTKAGQTGTALSETEKAELDALIDEANRLKEEAQNAVDSLTTLPEREGLNTQVGNINVPAKTAANDANNNDRVDTEEVAAVREKIAEAERAAEAARDKKDEVGTTMSPAEKTALDNLIDEANKLKEEAKDLITALGNLPEVPELTEAVNAVIVPEKTDANDANDNGKDDATEAQEALDAAKAKVKEAEDAAEAARNKKTEVGDAMSPAEKEALDNLIDRANSLKEEANTMVNNLGDVPEKSDLATRVENIVVPKKTDANDNNDNGIVDENETTPPTPSINKPDTSDRIPVTDPNNLTEDEINKVKEKLKEVNPGLKDEEIHVDPNGAVTITKEGVGEPIHLNPEEVIVPKVPDTNGGDGTDTGNGDGTGTDNGNTDGDNQPNPGTGDGNTDGGDNNTDNNGGTTGETDNRTMAEIHTINPLNPRVEVAKGNALTAEEKDKVIFAIKTANTGKPIAKVLVDPNGKATILYEDGSKDTLMGTETVVEKAAENPGAGNENPGEDTGTGTIANNTTLVAPTPKVLVGDPNALTSTEMDEVKAAITRANPDKGIAHIFVDANGNATVIYTDGSRDRLAGSETVEKKPTDTNNGGEQPTPGTGDGNGTGGDNGDGTGTGTEPGTGGDNGDGTGTGAEPGTGGDNGDGTGTGTEPGTGGDNGDGTGTGTGTEPGTGGDNGDGTGTGTEPGTGGDNGGTTTTPTTPTVTEADRNNPVGPNKPVEVVNPKQLTEEEKDKVKDAVANANPDIDKDKIFVDPEGNVTIVYGDGSSDDISSAETIVKKPADNTAGGDTGNNGGTPTTPTVTEADRTDIVAPTTKVEVENPEKLTPEEIEKVKDAVANANADKGITKDKITVSPKGEVTIEYGDHSADTLTPAETIVKKPADNTAGTGTGTDTGNTNGGDNGNTGNSGNNAGNGTSTTQPSIKLPAEKVKVVDTTKLTESEKAKVKEALIKANADLKDENIEVADNGNVTITKADGTKIKVSSSEVVEKEAIIIDLPMDKEFVESIFGKASTDKSDSNKDRVPNTGATSEATTALSASLMLMGALLVLKKRKEENR